MRTLFAPIGFALFFGIAVGVYLGRDSHAQGGVEQHVLVRTKLAEFPGKEALFFVGDFAPGARTPKHHHPGTEFLYVLEGNGEIEQQGRPTIQLAPGTAVFAEPDSGKPHFTHQAINTSSTDGMKTLVLLIIDEGSRPAFLAE